ncbi:hypothetical protein [Mycolicibacterium neworleansense]|uniref:Uncharacterized protein n=1 Tax=Mycolicibacterium neworleansense TaxID=146018 RepID=A0A0H5RVM3_9MYCO|nr:hypothetical protein [Mycolicibacterium neworleansense]MCV7365472.1 hypothetical protein [Mycolicibacterium neworleansense]CRZ17988.1 hypothetical protein BN2156_04885 [Mycolicibacterium neworleansense]
MDAVTALLYVTLGALADHEPVDVGMVLEFAKSGMTPELVEAGVDLYESLFDIGEL